MRTPSRLAPSRLAPSRLALGGGAASLATLGALVVGGLVATTATLVVGDPTAPRASADSLTRFGDCTELRDWFVEHGVAEVGPYGWNDPRVYLLDSVAGAPTGVERAPMPQGAESAAAGSTDARASSSTGTNTQEADVDEPDVAKTDGRRVVRLVRGGAVVVDDVTGAQPRELGRVSLPVGTYGAELLLAGDHVLVSQPGGIWHGPITDVPLGDRAVPRSTGARVIDVDISDPARPRIVHDDTYSGSLVSMRLYGDTVRVVTSTPRPDLPWATPDNPQTGRLSAADSTQRNRELVRSTTIADWLPAVVDNTTGSRTPLVDCGDVYRPTRWSGGDVTVVTTYAVPDPARRTSVAVTADGQVVYSSANRLYVASTRVAPPPPWRRAPGPQTGAPAPLRFRPTTELHAFALDGSRTRYVGSGHVAGSVRDRWSLDEHAGLLRVAWTRADPEGRTQNGITVLAEQDGALVPVGSIDRLGVEENIQSVRWFDDFAVLVTFRQMDPLYTIDLADPTHPREIGRLKIPGYSGYLHPIGGDLLLGLGVDADSEGRNLGGQAAVFDIRDLSAPRRLSQQGFGKYTYLPALEDPRGFTWLPDRHTGVTSVEDGSTGSSRLVALHVTAAGSLEVRDLAATVGANARTLPLADGRVAVVDQGLRVLEVG